MAYDQAHVDLDRPGRPSDFARAVKLKNLGLSVRMFRRGEGFDFFHNHREQEEVYFCLQGSADLKIGGSQAHTLRLGVGDLVRVDAATLRCIGNESSDLAVVLIAGACPHPYPGFVGHHDVIADVLSITGKGETGFRLPPESANVSDELDDNC